YRSTGEAGLLDRSSAPRSVANRTPEDRVQAIAALRRLRFTGQQIAEVLAMPGDDGVRDPHSHRSRQAWAPRPRACAALRTQAPRDPRRAPADRPWIRLPLGDPRGRLPRAWDSPPPDPAKTPADQRKGRALHPHDARRVGLQRDLSLERRANRCARGVPLALQ